MTAPRRMPRGQMRAKSAPATIGALLYSLERFDPVNAREIFPWAQNFVMGMPLAPWQRPFKWSLEQCARFVESAWMGVHLGTYIVTEMELMDRADVEFAPLSEMVLDGQQRLKALELYFTDGFALNDLDGNPTLWSEVDTVDRRRFQNTLFTRSTIPMDSEAQLRLFYDTLNFGGVAHLESERAMPGHAPEEVESPEQESQA